MPDLLTAPLSRGVLVVEGEEDVDRAASIGIVATTCAMGAGKWRPEYNEHFRGRSVYIIPDNDKPGREHAQQVAMSLHGIAKGIKVVADFIHEAAAALGCDESYIALPLLAGLASAVGNSRCIRLKRTWCEPAMVWAVAVGESGTLKSPAIDLATKPIHRLQNMALKQYKDQVEDYNRDKALYDADSAEWKKSGRKKGEPPPEPPAEPVAVRYLVSDCTVEALAVLLEQRPRGLLVARDELSGWVNSFDAYKSCRGADVAHWLSMHRAGPLTVDRKSGRRIIHVPRASVCIAGGVQPKALLVHLVRAESGDTSLVDAGAVDEQSIAAGVALSRWFGDEAARVYAIIGGDAETPEAREQRELVRIIRDRGGEITVRDLMHASRRYRAGAEEAEAALGRLVAAGILDVWEDKHGPRGGRPVLVFTFRDGGNGNTTGEIPEKKGVVLPLPPVVKGEITPAGPAVCLHEDVEEAPPTTQPGKGVSGSIGRTSEQFENTNRVQVTI